MYVPFAFATTSAYIFGCVSFIERPEALSDADVLLWLQGRDKM